MIDRRVLGAVRFVDAVTATIVTDGLRVHSSSALLRPNRSGLWVIWRTDGLESHTTTFEQAPSSPAIGSISIEVNVTDRHNRYLPRSATLNLPRDPSLINAEKPDGLFQPVELRLFPASSMPLRAGWAVIRAHVEDATAGQPSDGALIRVMKTAGNQVLARGMSDARGEALVAVPGIPITTFSSESGPALTTEIDVTVQATLAPPTPRPPNPDAIETVSGLPSQSLIRKLAAGREVTAEFAITAPDNFSRR